MKRLLLISVSTLLYNTSFIISPSYADEVVVTPYISGADVTISALNNNQNAIVNTLNGNVEGTINIKAGTINTTDLAQAVSPVTRWDESFNDYTVSGMLPVTDSDLTSDISAGVSYVNGYRISLSATAHTYTASKDTYVYISDGGYYVYQEVANGAATPSTPANTLLLAKVVTGAGTISSVSDLRTTSIQITTTTTNFPANYRDGAFVSRDSTTTMHVEPGSVAIGNTIYTRTTDTSTKTVTTTTNWVEGGYAPGGPTHIFLYAYNDAGSTWDFKYSTIDPVYSDTSSGVSGVLRYYEAGGVTYRAIGWAWLSADTIQSYEVGNFKDVNVSNYANRNSSQTQAGLSNTSYGTQLSQAEINFYTTGGKIELNGRINITNESGNPNPWSIAFAQAGSNIPDTEAILNLTNNAGFNLATFGTISPPQGSYKIQLQSKVSVGSVDVSTKHIQIEEK